MEKNAEEDRKVVGHVGDALAGARSLRHKKDRLLTDLLRRIDLHSIFLALVKVGISV